ncbi:MAG: DUF488 family protein [Actinomycetota bacterium]
MDTDGFRAALEALEERARDDALVIMCAETLWWRCHRRMISDALALDGVDVVHLIDAVKRQDHRLSEMVRRDERGRPVYD